MIYDLPKWAYIQTLLSRGDRRVGQILLAVHQARGDWGKALRETEPQPGLLCLPGEGPRRGLSLGFHRPRIPKGKIERRVSEGNGRRQ